MLVNGTSTGFFQNSRGLRLRDPFLPYLFVIAMEGFSCLLKRAMDGGFLSGCRLKGRVGVKKGFKFPICCLLTIPWCFSKLPKIN